MSKFYVGLETTSTLTVGSDATFAGKVGIGVGAVTPAQPLHIIDTNGANIILNSNTGAENSGIWMTEAAAASPYTNGTYMCYDGTNNAFKIKTGTTTLSTRLTIDRDTGNATFAGVLALPDGSVSAPSIGNTGDTNTGMYWPGDHQVGFAVNGSRKFYMSETQGYFQNLSSGISVSAGGIDVTGNSTFAGNVQLAATKKLYLDGGGSTYITESSDGVIDFYGDGTFLVSMKQNGTQSEVVVNEGSGDVDFRVEANNDAHAFFVEAEASGKVGIGTATPSSKLQIGSRGTASALTINAASGDGILFDFYNDGNPYLRHASIIANGDSSASQLEFWTSPSGAGVSKALTLDSSQNATFADDILTNTDSSSDIGKTATRWANLWVDSINGGAVVSGSYLPLAGGTMTGNINMNANKVEWDESGVRSWDMYPTAGNLYIAAGDGLGTLNLQTGLFVNRDATFGGDVTIPRYLYHSDDSNTYLEFSAADNLKLYAGGKIYFHAHDNGNLYLSSNNSTALTLDTSQDATFAGDVEVGGAASITPNANFSNLVITDSAHSGMSILSGNTSDGAIYFGDTDANNLGQIKYLHSSNSMTFSTSAGGASLTLDSGSAATFAGSVTIDSDTAKLYLGADDDLHIYHTGTDGYVLNKTGDLYVMSQAHGGDIIFKTENSSGTAVTPLSLDSAGDATFAGTISSKDISIKQADDSGFDGGLTIERSASTQKVHIGMDGGAVNFNSPDGLSYKFRNNGTEKFTLDSSGNATFAGAVTVAGTISGVVADATDNTSAVNYQQLSDAVAGNLVYQGVWNASTNTPTLAGGTGTPGYYYIVSVAGTTDLDGITDWEVGDWAIFSDLATDAWQKIDHTSVLTGDGTGGNLTAWAGAGTSNTLTDAPITYSGNNITVVGNITATGGNVTSQQFTDTSDSGKYLNPAGTSQITSLTASSNLTSLQANFTDNVYMSGGQLYIGAADATTDDSYRMYATSGQFVLASRESGTWTTRMDINTSGNTTFAGNVTAAQVTVPTYFNASSTSAVLGATGSGTVYLRPNGIGSSTGQLKIESSGDATFAGDIIASGGAVHILSNQITSGWNADSEDSDIWINYRGYAGGTTRYRDFRVGDGKGTQLLLIDGSAGSATFAGSVNAPIYEVIQSDTGTNITASSSYGVWLRNTSDTDGNFIPISFSNSTGFETARIGAEFQDAGDRNTDLFFCTRANSGVLTERMRIDSDGKIQVGSDKVIWAGGYGGGLIIRQNNVTSDRLIKMVTVDSAGAIANDNVLVVKGSQVGIGTDSPGAKLDVKNDDGVGNGLHIIADFNRSAGTDAQLILGYYADGSSVTGPVLYAANSKPLLFGVGGTEKMRITSAGDVGIGTTGPASKVHILGGSNNTVSQANANLNVEGAGGNGVVIGTLVASTYGSYLQAGYVDNFATAKYPLFLNPLGGKVAVETTSAVSKFQVGSHTFTGANGVHNNDRLGIMNNGSLTSIVNASTYNASTHPEYGLVFIQGPSTSSYNVWSISPDGPAKGDSLSFIFATNTTNIHDVTPKVVFDGNGYVGIRPTSKTWVPATLLSNSSNRIGNADGLTVNLLGLNWEIDGQGYAAAFSNLSTTAAQYNAGVLIEIASTDTTDRILDLESGGVNRFRMLGTGDAAFAGNVGVTNGNITTGLGATLGGVRYSGPSGYYSYITRNNGANLWAISLLGTDGDPANDAIGSDVFSINYSGNATFAGTVTATAATLTGDVTMTSSGSANSPTLAIDNPDSNAFNHAIEAFGANMTTTETQLIMIGKEGSTKNSGYIGYNWVGAGSDSNYVTIGHWGADHQLKIYGSGNATFTGHTTLSSGFTSGAASLIEDGVELRFGDDRDLKIYESGGKGFIQTGNSGSLKLLSDSITLLNEAGTESLAKFEADGAVSLYYDNSVALQTKSGNGIIVNGDVELNGDANIELETALNSAGYTSGTIIKFGTGTTVAEEVCYLNTSGAWVATNANALASSYGLLAVARGTSPTTHGMLTEGIFYDSGHSFAIGVPLYLNPSTSGTLTVTPPGSNDIARIVGYAIDANHIYFQPDKTWISVD